MLVIQQTRKCVMPRNATFPSQNKPHCQLAKTEVQFPVSSQRCGGDRAAPDAVRLLCGFTSWLAAPCRSGFETFGGGWTPAQGPRL